MRMCWAAGTGTVALVCKQLYNDVVRLQQAGELIDRYQEQDLKALGELLNTTVSERDRVWQQHMNQLQERINAMSKPIPYDAILQKAEGYVATIKSGVVTFRDGEWTGDASWGVFGAAFAPGEVPLQPGKTFAIEFETLENFDTQRAGARKGELITVDGRAAEGRARRRAGGRHRAPARRRRAGRRTA